MALLLLLREGYVLEMGKVSCTFGAAQDWAALSPKSRHASMLLNKRLLGRVVSDHRILRQAQQVIVDEILVGIEAVGEGRGGLRSCPPI